ncbi:uncharacterized protein [Panulirus ornatus]|uniref:uncharacterized protein n=1 Tax=Panulirus ornatus TaxID=150431 RepID=UPI003A8A846A
MDYSNGSKAAVHEKADVSSSMILADASEDVQEMTSYGSLALGFDSKEDWEEDLREAPSNSKNDLLSPTIPRKKLSGGFSLTPRLSGYEPSQLDSPKTEVGDQNMDLTTPHQSLCLHLDCPGRPAKGRKASHTPAAERSSCRYLFSQESSLSLPAGSASTTDQKVGGPMQDSKHGHHTHSLKLQPGIIDFSECTPSLSLKRKDLEKKFHQFSESEPILSQGEEKLIQNIGLACMLERSSLSTPEAELPTPIGSPDSESSVCSDCEACLSLSGSTLSSPILSQVKLMSQTIESSASDEECEKVAVVETVVDPPGSPAVDINDNIDHGSEHQLQLKMSPDMRELTSDTVTDTRPSEVKSGSLLLDVALIRAEEGLHREIIPYARKGSSSSDQTAKVARPEVNLTISSIGSTSSGWTAISGISPLPASDPTHLHHRHKHRHHHHHHHHHRGKHHHHSGHHSHTHSLSRSGDILLTSTPVHKNLVSERVNVSSVTSTLDSEFSAMLFPKESRFVMSSELQFSSSFIQSQVSVSEAEAPGNQEGTSPCLGSDSNKENIEPYGVHSSQETHFKLMQNSNDMKKVTTDADTSSNVEQICQSRKRQIETTGPDSEKDKCEKEEDMQLPQKKIYTKLISGNEMKSEFISISKPISWYHAEEVKDSSSASWIRELTKKEAEFLLAAPTNITDDIWDQLPSPRRSSSVDESLFRGVSSVYSAPPVSIYPRRALINENEEMNQKQPYLVKLREASKQQKDRTAFAHILSG